MRALLLVLLALASGRPTANAHAADTAGWLFQPDVVVQIRLGLSEESLAALAADPTEYVPATFTLSHEDRRFGPSPVSLKLKGGLGSFRDMQGKAAFKLKFPAGSRPDGLKKMTLNNMVQDPSKVREAVAYELFRAVGVAAPRTGYAEVFVNDEPYGLYLDVETLDDVALPRWYATTRHLYEGSYGHLTNPLDPFDDHYEVDEGDDDDREDLAVLLATAVDLSGGWYARMSAVADLDQMTRMWAAEAYLGHWDGYASWNTNNYYLHADGDGRFTMLPWGTDQTLVARTAFYENSPQHVLFNGCVADPICGALYGDALVAVTATAKRLRLDHRARRIQRGLRTFIDADPKLEHSPEAARVALASTIAFARERRRDVDAWSTLQPPSPRAVAVRGGAGNISVRWRAATKRASSVVAAYAVDSRAAGEPWTRRLVAPSARALVLTDLVPAIHEVRVRALAGPSASPATSGTTVAVTP